MPAFIGRTSDRDSRVFPPISKALYRPEASSDDAANTVAQTILRLAGQAIPRARKRAASRAEPANQIAYLLTLHLRAFEDECSGYWTRADFYWNEFNRILNSVWNDEKPWQALAQQADPLAGSDSSGLNSCRELIMDELFIDAHAAFYNGHASRDSLDMRAVWHVERILELCKLTKRSGESLESLLGPSCDESVKLLQEKQWNRAIRIASDRLDLMPEVERYQDSLTEMFFDHALARLEDGESERCARRNASTLGTCAEEVEKLRKRFPDNTTIIDSLAQVYRIRAINLANSGSVSTALLDAQKALAFDRSSEAIRETCDRLKQVMQNLQKTMQEIEAQIARTPNATLNAEGQSAQREARAGFGLVNKFIESGEFGRLTDACDLARTRNTFRVVGVPIPDENLDERHADLVQAIAAIIDSPPDAPSGLPAAWKKASRRNPYLAELPADDVCRFLAGRIFKEEAAEAVVAVPKAAPEPLATSVARSQPGEPFSEWLFSRQAKRQRVQAVAATVLLLLLGGVTLRESLRAGVRDAAYRKLSLASATGDYRSMVEASESFLSSGPFKSHDSREERVRSLYSQALVRWASSPDPAIDADIRAHSEKYKQLVLNSPLQ